MADYSIFFDNAQPYNPLESLTMRKDNGVFRGKWPYRAGWKFVSRLQ